MKLVIPGTLPMTNAFRDAYLTQSQDLCKMQREVDLFHKHMRYHPETKSWVCKITEEDAAMANMKLPK